MRNYLDGLFVSLVFQCGLARAAKHEINELEGRAPKRALTNKGCRSSVAPKSPLLHHKITLDRNSTEYQSNEICQSTSAWRLNFPYVMCIYTSMKRKQSETIFQTPLCSVNRKFCEKLSSSCPSYLTRPSVTTRIDV